MTTSNMSSILTTLEAALVAIDGSGSYIYDLSRENRVSWGVTETPPGSPHVAILDFAECSAETGNVLDAYTHDWSMTVVGWVSASTDSNLARFKAAFDLYSDVMQGLAADRTMGGKARDVVPSQPQVGATAAGVLPAYGWFVLPFHIEVRNGTGS